MITIEELDNDPWNTYPVNKDELRKLIHYREVMSFYDNDPDGITVRHVNDNPDGSADVEFTLGRNAARQLIKEGFLTALRKSLDAFEKEVCKSEDGDEMCAACDCWKHTRSMCG